MRFTKALGLAVLAAVAAMAFLGSSTASAQKHEIVLCKQLVALCPDGEAWPALSVALFLAEDPILKSGLGTTLCEDSLITAELASEIGNPLTSKNITAQFGILPTPKLGANCTGPCTNGATETIHAELEKLEVIIQTNNGLEGQHGYAVRGTGLALLLNCPIIGTCVYRGADRVSPIKHEGKHELHKGAENLPLAEFEETLERQTTHTGSVFCPSASVWNSRYALYLVHAPGGSSSGLGWPSLGVPASTEVVLCKDLVEDGHLCPEGEFYASGTKLLALASSPEFKASPFGPLKCEDSVIEAETTSDMSTEFGIKFTKIAFGKLPTPELGKGCTTCTEGIHPPPAVSGVIEMTGNDYLLRSSEAFELLSCFGLGVTCLYGSEGLESLVDDDAGKHKQASGEKGLAEILVSDTLFFIKGSNFCPEEGTWTANYVVYGLESGGEKVQGWLALQVAL